MSNPQSADNHYIVEAAPAPPAQVNDDAAITLAFERSLAAAPAWIRALEQSDTDWWGRYHNEVIDDEAVL
jgi:hypothetical protein